MHELTIGLIVLAIVLGVITLVGHGIWVLLALIFGGGKRPAENAALCVFCGHHTPTADPRCQWCGRELHTVAADELRDLAAVERQLLRWRQTGRLTSKEYERLLDRVRGYRDGLLRPAVARQEERPAAAPPAARARRRRRLREQKSPSWQRSFYRRAWKLRVRRRLLCRLRDRKR